MPVALVLGVSGATGAAVAVQAAARLGLDVVGYHRGRHADDAAALVRDVEATGRRCVLRTADASLPEAAEAGAKWLLAEFGPRSVKLFVHSLASASLGNLVVGDRALAPRQLTRSFDVMAHSFVWWSRALWAHGLLADDSRHFALGNPVVDSLADDLGAIAASKAALEIYVRVLARELGPEGHRVNLLKFGLVESRASKVAFEDDRWPKALAMAARVTPAGRLGTVEEVARLIVLLSGPDGAWFNGSTIDFTGGMSQGLLNLVHGAP